MNKLKLRIVKVDPFPQIIDSYFIVEQYYEDRLFPWDIPTAGMFIDNLEHDHKKYKSPEDALKDIKYLWELIRANINKDVVSTYTYTHGQ